VAIEPSQPNIASMYKECHIMNIGCTPHAYVDSGADPRAQHVSISFGYVRLSEYSVLTAMRPGILQVQVRYN
jgi:hypothetical protein